MEAINNLILIQFLDSHNIDYCINNNLIKIVDPLKLFKKIVIGNELNMVSLIGNENIKRYIEYNHEYLFIIFKKCTVEMAKLFSRIMSGFPFTIIGIIAERDDDDDDNVEIFDECGNILKFSSENFFKNYNNYGLC
jgi:hypothetical protein